MDWTGDQRKIPYMFGFVFIAKKRSQAPDEAWYDRVCGVGYISLEKMIAGRNVKVSLSANTANGIIHVGEATVSLSGAHGLPELESHKDVLRKMDAIDAASSKLISTGEEFEKFHYLPRKYLRAAIESRVMMDDPKQKYGKSITVQMTKLLEYRLPWHEWQRFHSSNTPLNPLPVYCFMRSVVISLLKDEDILNLFDFACAKLINKLRFFSPGTPTALFSSITRLLRSPDTREIPDAFWLLAELCVKMVDFWSVLPYVPDVDHKGRPSDWFMHAVIQMAGDCEDLNIMPKVLWDVICNGVWADPLVQDIQFVCRLYIPMGAYVLATAPSAMAVATSLAMPDGPGNTDPLLTASELAPGACGHWVTALHPRKLFFERAKLLGSNGRLPVWPAPSVFYPWESDLARGLMIAECTGGCVPFFLAYSRLMRDKQLGYALDMTVHENDQFGRALAKQCKGSAIRFDMMPVDVERALAHRPVGAIPSAMYRQFTQLCTDYFTRAEYSGHAFAPVVFQACGRRSDGRLYSGVSTRDMLLGTTEREVSYFPLQGVSQADHYAYSQLQAVQAVPILEPGVALSRVEETKPVAHDSSVYVFHARAAEAIRARDALDSLKRSGEFKITGYKQRDFSLMNGIEIVVFTVFVGHRAGRGW